MNFESALEKLPHEERLLAVESLSKLQKSGFFIAAMLTQQQHLLDVARQAGGNPEMESLLIRESKNFTIMCDFVEGLHHLLEFQTET